MKINILLAGAAALLMTPAIALAQTVVPAMPAPVDQTVPVDPAAPVAAPAEVAPATPAEVPATMTASVADGVTKEGGKYFKDGRKATKTEIAEYKRVEKAKRQ